MRSCYLLFFLHTVFQPSPPSQMTDAIVHAVDLVCVRRCAQMNIHNMYSLCR